MKNIKNVLYVVISIAVIILVVIISIGSRKKESLILKEGNETTGVLVNRKLGRDSQGFPIVSVSFDFYTQDKLVKHLAQYVSDEEYHRSIVGMKYKVKFLEKRPHVNSIILLDCPVFSEYENIEKERERIRDTYKNADVFLKKNARPLNEIQHLIP